jgi:hypothetical protein
MTCPECGTKIGVFRRKFSNTAYCSEACRLAARQKQNQASLALLLSNKKRHLAQLLAAAAPPPIVEAPPEPEPECAREVVHSGVLAPFAPFAPPSAHRAPTGRALLEEEPAAAGMEARWQDAVLTAAGPGLGVTGWMAAATNCLRGFAGTLPDPTAPAAAERDARSQLAVLPAAGPCLRITGWVDTGTRCLRPVAAASPDFSPPNVADWGARWQGAVQHGLRRGFGVTGWIMTAMSCLQPLVAAMPAPCAELSLPFTTLRARAGTGANGASRPVVLDCRSAVSGAPGGGVAGIEYCPRVCECSAMAARVFGASASGFDRLRGLQVRAGVSARRACPRLRG